MEEVVFYTASNDSINIISSTGKTYFLQKEDANFDEIKNKLVHGEKDMSKIIYSYQIYPDIKTDSKGNHYIDEQEILLTSNVKKLLNLTMDTPMYKDYLTFLKKVGTDNTNSIFLKIPGDNKDSYLLLDPDYFSINEILMLNHVPYIQFPDEDSILSVKLNHDMEICLDVNKQSVVSMIKKNLKPLVNIVFNFYTSFWKKNVSELGNISETVKNNTQVQFKFIKCVTDKFGESDNITYLLKDITNPYLMMSLILSGHIEVKNGI